MPKDSKRMFIKYLCPLIVACSSENMDNPFVIKELEDAGFDFRTEAPLSIQYTKKFLIPQV
jgi:hypothetical protein